MVRDYLKLLRIYQWTKSGFIFLPVVFSGLLPIILNDPFGTRALDIVFRLACAFLAFSFAASSVYVFNDYRDRHQDALDERKKKRPIASGRIGAGGAIVAICVLLLLAAAFASRLPHTYQIILIIYVAQNIFYTLIGKRILLLDVFFIAVGFVFRVLAGASAIEVEASPWLLSCTLFLALFLGFFKRYYELRTSPPEIMIGGQYTAESLKNFISITASLSVMNYAIYTLEGKYASERLYWTIPLVVLGIFRYYTLMDRSELEDGNPSDVLLNDKFLIAVIAVWILLCAALLLHLAG
ncbi:MAG: UbiA prenyltransferase family protein [Leptospirales bacterium]|nr:UbiA prenyltransferase family protein [Leptospirales bacterium]